MPTPFVLRVLLGYIDLFLPVFPPLWLAWFFPLCVLAHHGRRLGDSKDRGPHVRTVSLFDLLTFIEKAVVLVFGA